MSLLSRIFGTKSESSEISSIAQATTPEFESLLAFGGALMRLLNEDRYIARSDYKPIVEEYQKTRFFFENLQASNLLSMYCQTNGLDEKRIKKAAEEEAKREKEILKQEEREAKQAEKEAAKAEKERNK